MSEMSFEAAMTLGGQRFAHLMRFKTEADLFKEFTGRRTAPASPKEWLELKDSLDSITQGRMSIEEGCMIRAHGAIVRLALRDLAGCFDLLTEVTIQLYAFCRGGLVYISVGLPLLLWVQFHVLDNVEKYGAFYAISQLALFHGELQKNRAAHVNDKRKNAESTHAPDWTRVDKSGNGVEEQLLSSTELIIGVADTYKDGIHDAIRGAKAFDLASNGEFHLSQLVRERLTPEYSKRFQIVDGSTPFAPKPLSPDAKLLVQKCTNCGGMNPAQSMFCENCGTPLFTPPNQKVK